MYSVLNWGKLVPWRMFDARLFSRMKRGAYFINISRGGCVVTADLIAALRAGQLAGAGLDVVDPEPLPPDARCGGCQTC